MRAEQLRQWLREAMWEKDPYSTQWLKVVSILQEEFRGGKLANDSTWQIVVLIPKGYSRDFCGVGLIEVLWKAVTGLLNRRFTLAIQFHDVLYGFWLGRGTGTANLNTKMLQHITAIREAVLYDIFLGLQKAYATLDRNRCHKIIAMYGVGPRVLSLLWMYWGWLTMVDRAGGYYGTLFKGYRGVTQGDPLFPTILNVFMESVICHWVMVVVATEADAEELGVSI